MIVRVKILFLLGLLAAAALEAGSTTDQEARLGTSEQSRASPIAGSEKRVVIRVIDGDTIVVSPNEKVRLIGVNTPETVHPKKPAECYGKEAKEFTRSTLEGKSIRLAFDEKRHQHKDKFRRTLAYAYLEDGTMLNRELIRQGYAKAETRFRFDRLTEFVQVERKAQDQGLGLWSSCPLR